MTGDTVLAHSWKPSPNCGPRIGVNRPDMLIMHYTAMASAESAIDWLCLPASQVSCHYLIDEAGQITQMVSEDIRAWHAGAAHWAGVADINSHSIGIEIQNPGPAAAPPVFPASQMAAVRDLSLDIMARHPIPQQRVLAHSDVAPGRKIDPGETFDWQWLHQAGIGHWVAPKPIIDGPVLRPGDSGAEVAVYQGKLKSYGYGIEQTGLFDDVTMRVTQAFQLHFRQAKVDGVADLSTRTTLEVLLAAL